VAKYADLEGGEATTTKVPYVRNGNVEGIFLIQDQKEKIEETK
jgi:hypothetical protein